MVQAYAQQLLNQKESALTSSVHESEHPLQAATYRLVTALERLEHNLEQVTVNAGRDSQNSQQVAVFERENATLRREQENLNVAISQLQYQYNDLHQVASTIYGKLDDAIKRLTKIIDN